MKTIKEKAEEFIKANPEAHDRKWTTGVRDLAGYLKRVHLQDQEEKKEECCEACSIKDVQKPHGYFGTCKNPYCLCHKKSEEKVCEKCGRRLLENPVLKLPNPNLCYGCTKKEKIVVDSPNQTKGVGEIEALDLQYSIDLFDVGRKINQLIKAHNLKEKGK